MLQLPRCVPVQWVYHLRLGDCAWLNRPRSQASWKSKNSIWRGRKWSHSRRSQTPAVLPLGPFASLPEAVGPVQEEAHGLGSIAGRGSKKGLLPNVWGHYPTSSQMGLVGTDSQGCCRPRLDPTAPLPCLFSSARNACGCNEHVHAGAW